MTRPGTTRTRTLRGLVLGVCAALALTGCGTHPGSAATVGSERISDDRVDTVATALCPLLAQGSQTGPQEVAGRVARQDALVTLLSASLSRQYAAAHRLQVDQGRVSALIAGYEPNLGVVPANRRAALRGVLRDVAEDQLILAEAGRRELARQGRRNVPEQQALLTGRRLRAAWVRKSVDVAVDPRYGRFTNGSLVSRSGSLSVPVSAAASAGSKARPSASWVSALPAAQKCR